MQIFCVEESSLTILKSIFSLYSFLLVLQQKFLFDLLYSCYNYFILNFYYFIDFLMVLFFINIMIFLSHHGPHFSDFWISLLLTQFWYPVFSKIVFAFSTLIPIGFILISILVKDVYVRFWANYSCETGPEENLDDNLRIAFVDDFNFTEPQLLEIWLVTSLLSCFSIENSLVDS